MLHRRRAFNAAMQSFQNALVAYAAESCNNEELLGTIYHNVAAIHNAKGNYKEASENIERCLGIRAAILPKLHPTLEVTYDCNAISYHLSESCVLNGQLTLTGMY